MTTLFLFDIDGTLVRGDGAGRRAMDRAFHRVLGHAEAMAGIRFDGATDRGLVRAALEARGHPVEAELVDALLARYLDALDEEMAVRAPFRALTGAAEVARGVAELGLVGLGTGNIEPAAWRKMRAVGMHELFRFGGFGSDAEVRAEVLAHGVRRGAALAGKAPEACAVVVIGDSERDIEAARAIGARMVAVATGGTSRAALEALGPDVVLDAFDDVAAACRHIAGRD